MSYNSTTQEIIDRVKCPCRVFTDEDSTVQEVMDEYNKALARGKEEGFVPALVISDDTLAEWLEILEDEDSYSKDEVISKNRGDAKEILEQRFEEYIEDYVDDINEDITPEEDDMLLSELMGEKTGGDTLSQFLSISDYNSDGIEETILFEIPVKNPWELIAWIPMGGWNECPEVSEMMEVCRYWYEQYGAIPAVFSHDTLEFMLEKPVTDEEEVWKLAKEHYAFCPDCVDQSTANGTIGEVADRISKSDIWFFWWD